MVDITPESTLKYPNCGYRKTETMPTDSCQYLDECGSCGRLLTPRHGDCCVFCSYGTVARPPIQQGAGCCAPGQ